MPGARRRVFTRTKTGCLTCRERRKKCDELAPVCTGCSRNFILCRWPTSRHVHPVLPVEHRPESWPYCGEEDETITASGTSRLSTSKDSSQNEAVDFSLDDFLSPAADSQFSSVGSVVVRSDDELEGFRCGLRYLYPPRSVASSERAVALTPSSPLLLQHYLGATSGLLVAKPPFSNPFVTLVLPLTFSDDLLMHSVLALSGTHLSFKKGDDLDIQLATHQHYASVLQNLKATLAARTARTADTPEEDIERSLRLLLVLMILCYVEAISGEPNGGIFPHLRLSRLLILEVLRVPRRSLHSGIEAIQGFVLEVYSWLVVVNSITPYCGNRARAIEYDSFLDSLEFLKEYDTFGFFLSCGQGLFELIPCASVLAMKTLTEENSQQTSPETKSEYITLEKRVTQWRPPIVAPEMSDWKVEHEATGEIYRQALLIFIKASKCGSLIQSPKVIAAIQHHIDIAMPLFGPVSKSLFNTLLLWPVMIIGSCLICDHQRKEMIRSLHEERRVDVCQVREAAKLLTCLWEDEDDHSYGPFGLQLIMKKRKMNFGVS